jgi:hypothetical protein
MAGSTAGDLDRHSIRPSSRSRPSRMVMGCGGQPGM